MGEGDEVRGPAGAVADDHRHRGRVRHVLEDGADGVGAALDDQADERRREVGGEPLRRDELLELPLEGDLGAVLAHRPVVHQQEVGVVLVQRHEAGPEGRRRVSE